MANDIAPQGAWGWDLLLALGIGIAVIVALAVAAGRWTVSAAWQATLWRIVTLGMFLLLVFELTGLGQGVAELCRRHVMRDGEVSAVFASAAAVGAPPGAAESAAAGDTVRGTTLPAVSSRHAPETPAADSPCADPQALAGRPYSGRAETLDAVQSAPAALAATAPASDAAARAPRFWLAVAWAMGTAAVLAQLLGSRAAAWFFRRNCPRCDDEAVLARTAALQLAFGIPHSVAVLTSPRIAAPVVLGGWRPALVLPPRFACDFDPQQQETILAHELAHVASCDSVWQSAALVVCALVWWHPLAWWSRRQLRAAHEALADEASLVVPDGPRILAEALVLLGQRLVRLQPRFGLSLGGSRFRSSLGRRVQRLLSLPRRPRPAPRRARLAFAHFSLPVLVALAAIAGTAWVPFQVPPMQGETTMSVFSNSWRRSLVATAIWTMLAAAPAVAADQDSPAGAPVAADRGKIEQRLRSIKEKVVQLEKDGKYDEAEKLKRDAAEIMAKARAADGDSAAPQSAVSDPGAEKVRAQLKELSQRVAQLEKDGKHDEAQRLKSEALALYSKINPRANAVAIPGGAEREQLRQQWLALRAKIEKAIQEGRPDDVQRLEQEVKTLQAKLYPQEGYASSQSQSGGDREARLQHLRAAAENLKAAGFDSEAQHVLQMASRLKAEGSVESQTQGQSTYPRQERPSSGGSSVLPPASSAANSGQYATAPAVQELRGQVDEMRRELRELREQLNRASP